MVHASRAELSIDVRVVEGWTAFTLSAERTHFRTVPLSLMRRRRPDHRTFACTLPNNTANFYYCLDHTRLASVTLEADRHAWQGSPTYNTSQWPFDV